jgi:addiction module HigA family antidote
MNLSPYALAKACDVPRTRIERLIREETPVTADTALRLGKALNTSPAFWMNMQARFDLEVAEDALAGAIKKIAPIGKRQRESMLASLTITSSNGWDGCRRDTSGGRARRVAKGAEVLYK